MIFRTYKNLDNSIFPFCHNTRVCQTDGRTDKTPFSSLVRAGILCIAEKPQQLTLM